MVYIMAGSMITLYKKKEKILTIVISKSEAQRLTFKCRLPHFLAVCRIAE